MRTVGGGDKTNDAYECAPYGLLQSWCALSVRLHSVGGRLSEE